MQVIYFVYGKKKKLKPKGKKKNWIGNQIFLILLILFIRKQTFVDLGCGNGLLTFLLVSEGYEGYGIDIADRKIWPALCKDNKDMLRGKS